MSPRVVVLVPTYNEAGNIEALIGQLLALGVPGLEICVVDDLSPDGTGEKVAALEKKSPAVRLLSRRGPRGRGYAGREGFLDAFKRGAQFVVEMDADFSHQPRQLPALLDAMASCDVAIGSRLVSGGSDDDRGLTRRALTALANAYARALLGLPVADVNSGFRCFSRPALEKMNLDTLRSAGPSIIHEMLFRAARAGLKIREVPITFVERKTGDSKLDLSRLVSGYLWILRLRLSGSK